MCGGKVIMVGVNDIWTINSDLAKLLANPEDGHKYTQCSNKKVDWKCPECGNIITNRSIDQIFQHGLSCPHCSDGISYPEKFMRNLLQQLHIDFEYQFSPFWCKYKFKNKNKTGRYDFYIPSRQIIIEMDGGLGHGNRTIKQQTVEESKYIDDIKDELAYKHGIQVIRIDCSYEKQHELSRYEFIKRNTILKLLKIFNLAEIDWNQCDKMSLNTNVKLTCYLWNFHTHDTLEISKIIKLNRSTIIDYLHCGNRLGWCDYNSKNESLKSLKKNGLKTHKKVICVTTGEIFDSLKEAQCRNNANHISDCCNCKRNFTGKLSDGTKLQWMYYDEYIKL